MFHPIHSCLKNANTPKNPIDLKKIEDILTFLCQLDLKIEKEEKLSIISIKIETKIHNKYNFARVFSSNRWQLILLNY